MEEDFISYTGVNDKANAKQVLQQIKAAMSKAKASDGKVRFADFEGATDHSNLAKLQTYNENKVTVRQGKIEKLDESSRFYLKQAEEDYESNNISLATYDSIRSGIIQNGRSLIRNPNDGELSNTVSDHVRQDTNQWVDKVYNQNMIANRF